MGSCPLPANKAGFLFFFFSTESTLCIKVEIQIPFPPLSAYIYEVLIFLGASLFAGGPPPALCQQCKSSGKAPGRTEAAELLLLVILPLGSTVPGEARGRRACCSPCCLLCWLPFARAQPQSC